jgi:hypothetical protein
MKSSLSLIKWVNRYEYTTLDYIVTTIGFIDYFDLERYDIRSLIVSDVKSSINYFLNNMDDYNLKFKYEKDILKSSIKVRDKLNIWPSDGFISINAGF